MNEVDDYLEPTLINAMKVWISIWMMMKGGGEFL